MHDPTWQECSGCYWLAGSALVPVRLIMDEMDAIKDGRSLHRRLAVPLSNDELARLALTLNGMLARLETSFGSLHRFTADASHELKTPLMVLRAGVERALTHPSTPSMLSEECVVSVASVGSRLGGREGSGGEWASVGCEARARAVAGGPRTRRVIGEGSGVFAWGAAAWS